MSDFVLEYDVLASIIGYSKDLERQTNDYAEELERKIVTAIDNVTGTSSGNLTSAKDLVCDKIKTLKRKSDNFNYLAKQISDLLEVAVQMDQAVADTIAMQSKYNVVHNKSGRLENWMEKILRLLVGIGNNKVVMKLITDSLKYYLPGSKLTIDFIKEWYKEAFTEYRKSEWMSGYGKEVRKFTNLRNSSDNDNVDLKNAIKNWYKDPDYKQNSKSEDKDNRKLLPYEQDLINLKYARNLPQAYRYLLKYLWDRFPGLYSEQMKQMAIIGGMDPEWAEIYGDFATMPLLEGFAVVTVKGVQAIKNLKTGEIIYSESVVAGSGVGNLTNKANAGSKAIGEGSGNLKPQGLIDELANSGVKYNPDDVVAVTKTADGKLVWLENGNPNAGLNHIMNHADDFAAQGISKNEISNYVMDALENGKIVGYQGRGTGRPIYEFTYNGEVRKVAITTGNNGFVVGANPVSTK
jgi:hypothetical protein